MPEKMPNIQIERAKCVYCYQDHPTREMHKQRIVMHPSQRHLEKSQWYCDRTCAMKDQMAHEG